MMRTPFFFLALITLLPPYGSVAEARVPEYLLNPQQVYLVPLGYEDLTDLRRHANLGQLPRCCSAGSLEPMAQQLRARLAQHGNDPRTLALLGQVELEQRLTIQASQRFEQALALDGQQIEALIGLAQLALAQGRKGDYQRYHFLIERHPGLEWPHLAYLAKAQLRLGHTSDAQRLVQQAERKWQRAASPQPK